MFGYFGKYGQTFEFSIFFFSFDKAQFHLTWENIVLQDFKSFLKGFDWKDDCLKINAFALFDNYKYAIIMARAAISPRECLLFTLHLF